MAQERISTSTTHEQEATEATVEEKRAMGEQALRSEELTNDVDGLLDEIADVLEENAQEFVEGFRQKGGQ